MSEHQVTELLAAAVAKPPADRLDVDAMVVGGSRRRRRRTLGTLAAVAAVLVVVAAVVVTSRPAAEAPPADGGPSATAGVAVPDLVGLSQRGALDAIRAAGLAPGALTPTQTDIPHESLIVSQSPAPGSRVAPGSTIDAAIGDGTSWKTEGLRGYDLPPGTTCAELGGGSTSPVLVAADVLSLTVCHLERGADRWTYSTSAVLTDPADLAAAVSALSAPDGTPWEPSPCPATDPGDDLTLIAETTAGPWLLFPPVVECRQPQGTEQRVVPQSVLDALGIG